MEWSGVEWRDSLSGEILGHDWSRLSCFPCPTVTCCHLLVFPL